MGVLSSLPPPTGRARLAALLAVGTLALTGCGGSGLGPGYVWRTSLLDAGGTT